MKFAKLENSKLIKCPLTGYSEGKFHLNLPLYYKLNQDKATADGWLELVETPRPEGNYLAKYKVYRGKVVQYWEELPEPKPEPTELDRLRADVDYIALCVDVELD